MTGRGEQDGLGVPNAELRELLGALKAFPANGKPPNTDATVGLIHLGFIERREVKEACKTCGTPRLAYSFFRITGAGRYFLAASAMSASGQDPQGLEAKPASAVPKADAQ